jgi:hypothetical protein
MYARYGYGVVPATGLARFDSVGQLAYAVVCRTDVLPEPTLTQVGALRAALHAGVPDRRLEISRGSHAVFRFAGGDRARRRTAEW